MNMHSPNYYLENKRRLLEYQRQYKRTEAGRLVQKKYRESDKGKAAARRCNESARNKLLEILGDRCIKM